jgi:IS5 family transposase
MLGKRERRQPELFVAGSLGDLVPDDHVLVRVERVLDLAWLPGEVADCYCADNGRPGIDPEVAVRLMRAGLLLGVIHDRRLLREAQVNLAIRWFIGYGLHEQLPDHSSLTRIRQRWGAARFQQILLRTVQACVAAGIAKGEVVHIDSSLIRADVSWDAIARHHAEAVSAANGDAAGSDGSNHQGAAGGGCVRSSGKVRVVCTSDPDATLATDHRARRSEPASKQHTAVDGAKGVVLDVTVTTGAVHDSMTVEAQLDAIPARTGAAIRTATMDGAYAITRVFASLEQRGIEAIVPAKRERPPKAVIPVRRFKLDARNGIVRCPRGRILKPHGKPDRKGFQAYRAQVRDCRACPLRAACVSPGMERRAILLHKDHPALLRARRKRARWAERERGLYAQHRCRVEGIHGEAKTWHGLARAVRRGLANMQIQAYLVAAVINLKRLAAAVIALVLAIVAAYQRPIAADRTLRWV